MCSFDTLVEPHFTQVLSLLIHLTLTLQGIHESNGAGSGLFAVVSWHDSVRVTVDSRSDGVVSIEVSSTK